MKCHQNQFYFYNKSKLSKQFPSDYSLSDVKRKPPAGSAILNEIQCCQIARQVSSNTCLVFCSWKEITALPDKTECLLFTSFNVKFFAYLNKKIQIWNGNLSLFNNQLHMLSTIFYKHMSHYSNIKTCEYSNEEGNLNLRTKYYMLQ